jgi:hypothetical protein
MRTWLCTQFCALYQHSLHSQSPYRCCWYPHTCAAAQHCTTATDPVTGTDALLCCARFLFVSPANWALNIRGMHEQAWHELDEHGIGRILAVVVVKISVRTQMWTLRTRANQVASVNVTSIQGATHCGREARADWEVEVGSNFAGALDEKVAHAATAPESAVG